jgi:hypothetical protein
LSSICVGVCVYAVSLSENGVRSCERADCLENIPFDKLKARNSRRFFITHGCVAYGRVVATNRVRVRSVVAEEVVVCSALRNDRSAAGDIGTG